MDDHSGFQRGDLVEVKSLEEILSTLDADAKLEGLPFMPEMARYCGRQVRVYRRATKTCVEGLHLRRMENTVLLEGLRCDGSAHAGCQRACLLFWKEAWLRPVAQAATSGEGDNLLPVLGQGCDLSRLPTRKGDRFYCQSTELPGATADFPAGNLRHLFADLFRGDATLAECGHVLWWKVRNRLRSYFGRGLYRRRMGRAAKPTKGALNLQPGDWVEVKSADELSALLDAEGKNHGLAFEPEMLDYCGQRYKVAFRVGKIICEEPGKQNSGKMVELANTVALEGITCRGICVKNCPRANYLWWRESWLTRVAPEPDQDSGCAEEACEEALSVG